MDEEITLYDLGAHEYTVRAELGQDNIVRFELSNDIGDCKELNWGVLSWDSLAYFARQVLDEHEKLLDGKGLHNEKKEDSQESLADSC